MLVSSSVCFIVCLFMGWVTLPPYWSLVLKCKLYFVYYTEEFPMIWKWILIYHWCDYAVRFLIGKSINVCVSSVLGITVVIPKHRSHISMPNFKPHPEYYKVSKQYLMVLISPNSTKLLNYTVLPKSQKMKQAVAKE